MQLFFSADVRGAAQVPEPLLAVFQVHHFPVRNLPGESDQLGAGAPGEPGQQPPARPHQPRGGQRLYALL